LHRLTKLRAWKNYLEAPFRWSSPIVPLQLFTDLFWLNYPGNGILT
jgi:hypothetical protein